MARKSRWILITLFVISVGILCCVPEPMAETLNYKSFVHVTQRQMVQVGDVAVHWVVFEVREGSAVLENGEMVWVKTVLTSDVIRGGGPFTSYSTFSFQDGSTIITRTKGTSGQHSASGPPEAKITPEIIKGTGRFEGIKGTVSARNTFMPLEKGELGEKVLGEGTLTYTLPSK